MNLRGHELSGEVKCDALDHSFVMHDPLDDGLVDRERKEGKQSMVQRKD